MNERGEPPRTAGLGNRLVRLVVAVAVVCTVVLATALAMGWSERPILTLLAGGGAVVLLLITIVLSARLARMHAELAGAQVGLASARAQLVQERRRLLRDIHDGLQPALLAVGMRLDSAIRQAPEPGTPPMDEIVEATADLRSAVVALRQITADVYPGALASMGLRAAIESLADRLPIPVTVQVPDRRLPSTTEYGVYFLVSEALANVVKHARAERATVVISEAGQSLRVEVTDDGIGGADSSGGGLTGLRERMREIGGELDVDSLPRRGTRVIARIPCES